MVKIEISSAQIKTAIAQLSLKERAKLLEEIQRDTWQAQFRRLLDRIDARRRKNPLSQKELNRIIASARKECYAKDKSRH